MKKSVLLFVLVLSLGYLWVSGGKRVLEEERSFPVLSEQASRPAGDAQPPIAQEQQENQRQQDSVRSVSSAPVLPSGYFPEARVVSSVTLEGKRRDEVRVIKTVETTMAEPYVRIEETYRTHGQGRELVDQAAMVANQILVNRPRDLEEPAFVGILRSAGAVDVKKRGASYLATFPALPDDPQALESFIERVRELSGGSFVIEPNYIRKLF